MPDEKPNIIDFNREMMNRIRLYSKENPNKIVTVLGKKEITRRDMLEQIDSGSTKGMLYYSALSTTLKIRDARKQLNPERHYKS